jgi:hypothetical protein
MTQDDKPMTTDTYEPDAIDRAFSNLPPIPVPDLVRGIGPGWWFRKGYEEADKVRRIWQERLRLEAMGTKGQGTQVSQGIASNETPSAHRCCYVNSGEHLVLVPHRSLTEKDAALASARRRVALLEQALAIYQSVSADSVGLLESYDRWQKSHREAQRLLLSAVKDPDHHCRPIGAREAELARTLSAIKDPNHST